MSALLLAIVATPALAASAGDVLVYDIDATLDAKARLIRARASIAVPSSARAAPDEVRLDFSAGGEDASGPRLVPGEVSGGTLTPIPGVRALLSVRLPVAPSGPARIEITWTMRLDDEARATMGYDAIAANDPTSLWYPDVVGADGRRPRFRDFRVALTSPASMAVLTSGTLEKQSTTKGSVRSVYTASHAEGFALNFGEGFALIEVSGPPVRVIALAPASDKRTFKTAAEITARAARFFAKTYGFFPIEQIGLAPGDPAYKGGYPASNLFYIHGRDRSPAYLDWIIPHELGHYYWGLYVQSASFEQLDWVMLANGIWADQLYQAQVQKKELDEVWRANEWTERAVAAQLAGRDQRLGISAEEEGRLDFDYNSAVRHAKGALGLWLQARRLGTGRFLDLQRQLLGDFRNRPLSADELARRLEAAGAGGAEEFFRAFVRGDAILAFEVAAVESERTEAGWRYSISIVRRGTLRYPVDIEVLSRDGERVRQHIAGTEAKEKLVVALKSPLAEVRLDPEGVLPLWNSAHPGVRRMYARALDRAGLTEAFLVWGRDYLRAHPEDAEIRARLIERLSALGRCEAAAEVAGQGAPEPCRSALAGAGQSAASGPRLSASDGRIKVSLNASEAEAVLGIIEARSSGHSSGSAEWSRLATCEPYVRLKQREATMGRPFADDEFRAFVMSDELRRHAPALRQTLSAWSKIDLAAVGQRALAYLPQRARIAARIFPVIKPKSNSFVFEVKTNAAVFLFLDPTLTREQLENTIAHELHHVGIASIERDNDPRHANLTVGARAAFEWMGAFAEGVAMLAAAGGPAAHPHAASRAEDRARWDRDMSRVDEDMARLEAFFLNVLSDAFPTREAIDKAGFEFFGEQGPWYTVGWQMASLVERHLGREALVACLDAFPSLLLRYNAVAAQENERGGHFRLWSAALVDRIAQHSSGQPT